MRAEGFRRHWRVQRSDPAEGQERDGITQAEDRSEAVIDAGGNTVQPRMAGNGGNSRAHQREDAAADAVIRTQRFRRLEQQRVVGDDALRAGLRSERNSRAGYVERNDNGRDFLRRTGIDGQPVVVPRFGQRRRKERIETGAKLGNGRHSKHSSFHFKRAGRRPAGGTRLSSIVQSRISTRTASATEAAFSRASPARRWPWRSCRSSRSRRRASSA